MLLAWQDSSELRQLLSQLSCAGERSGRGETLPAGAEEGSRCVIPFCSLDGRDHRANAGHKGSSEKPHTPKDNRSSYSCLAKHISSWQPALAEPVPAAPGASGTRRVPAPPQSHRCRQRWQGCRGDTANPALESLHECEKRLEKLHEALNNPWAILCHSKTSVQMRSLTTENSSDALVGSKKTASIIYHLFFPPLSGFLWFPNTAINNETQTRSRSK